jgi:hypothetical protein
MYRDLIFNPGRRLRVSIGDNTGVWIRWGWRAQWQLHLNRYWSRWYFHRGQGSIFYLAFSP